MITAASVGFHRPGMSAMTPPAISSTEKPTSTTPVSRAYRSSVVRSWNGAAPIPKKTTPYPPIRVRASTRVVRPTTAHSSETPASAAIA